MNVTAELLVQADPPALAADPPIKFPLMVLPIELDVVPGTKFIAVIAVLVEVALS